MRPNVDTLILFINQIRIPNFRFCHVRALDIFFFLMQRVLYLEIYNYRFGNHFNMAHNQGGKFQGEGNRKSLCLKRSFFITFVEKRKLDEKEARSHIIHSFNRQSYVTERRTLTSFAIQHKRKSGFEHKSDLINESQEHLPKTAEIMLREKKILYECSID